MPDHVNAIRAFALENRFRVFCHRLDGQRLGSIVAIAHAAVVKRDHSETIAQALNLGKPAAAGKADALDEQQRGPSPSTEYERRTPFRSIVRERD